MAIELVKQSSEGRSLSTEEILRITDKCGCGRIKQAYQQITDGSIRKVGLCPECMRENLARARAARVPGAPRKRRKTQEPEPAQPTEQAVPPPVPDLRERLEAARREAIARAEEAVVDSPASPGCRIVITLDLDKDRALYNALDCMAADDCRTLTQEVYWIVREYVRDHVRYLERQTQATQ